MQAKVSTYSCGVSGPGDTRRPTYVAILLLRDSLKDVTRAEK